MVVTVAVSPNPINGIEGVTNVYGIMLNLLQEQKYSQAVA